MKFLTAAVLFLCTGALFAQRPGPPPNDPWNYNQGPGNWDNSWNSRPNPRRGACLYKDYNFSGDHFCVKSGDRLAGLPGNFGNRVSSIRLYGGAQITVFNDANFQNGNTTIRNSVSDLRRVPFRDGHTWNDRMSSVVVR